MCKFTHNVNFTSQFWFTLFCREAIFVANLRTFGCTIFRPENVWVWKNDKYQVWCWHVDPTFMLNSTFMLTSTTMLTSTPPPWYCQHPGICFFSRSVDESSCIDHEISTTDKCRLTWKPSWKTTTRSVLSIYVVKLIS